MPKEKPKNRVNKGWFKKGHPGLNKKPNCGSFKKGFIPWNKGKKGVQVAWNKGLGITPIERRMRVSEEYKEWRKSVLERDDYTCQSCYVRGGILQADHIKSFASYPESRLDISNGRTLCVQCHRKTATFGWKIYNQKLKDMAS